MKVICVHRLPSIGEKIFLYKILQLLSACAPGERSIAGERHTIKSYYQLLYTSWMAVVSTGLLLENIEKW